MDLVQLPSPGELFANQWTVGEEVGKGGFSVVFRVTHPDGRVAALKILLPESGDTNGAMDYDADLADRFLREARLLEQLDSPYTIKMWEYGESPTGLLFMLFEFIDGRSLFEEIKHGGPLDPSRVIHILRQTLVGLNSAHELGILHRDIKPNNIMLFERGGDPDRVKLVDFGIAKMYGEAEAMPGNDLTAAGLLVGTPRYMSPEQLKGQPLEPTSDLYSLGLCAIEMLTGRKCIPGKDRVKIVEMQLRPEPIVVPESVEVGAGLRNVVHGLTQKSLDTRYSSAADALRDLESLAGDPGATGDTVFESVPASLAIPESAPGPGDEETVLHRVNTAELDALIASQGGPPVTPPDDPTVADPAAAVPDDLAQTQPVDQSHPPPDQSFQSGQFNRPPSGQQAFGSGEYQRPPAQQAGFGSGEYNRPPSGQQAFGSGEYNRPPSGQQAFGSGEYQRPPPQQTGPGSGEYNRPVAQQAGFGSGEHNRPPAGFGSGEYARPAAADQSFSSNEIQRPPPTTPEPTNRDLTTEDKIALGASVLLPGVGHLLLKQMYKGIGAIVLLVVTVGVGWILLAPLAFADAFLVIRARKRREVGDLEFFPDYQEIL